MDLSRPQKLLVIVGLVALLVGIIVLSLGRMAAKDTTVTYVAPKALPQASTTPAAAVSAVQSQWVAVHVVGAVYSPGMYWLKNGCRVADAVQMAGGMLPEADQTSVNLASALQDGEQIKVLAQPEDNSGQADSATAAPAAVPAASAGTGGDITLPPKAKGAAVTWPISLNQATKDQLELLPGIGPALSARILYYRYEHGGFRSVEELMNVSGISQHRLEALRPYLRP
jgi:competence protein ComEA